MSTNCINSLIHKKQYVHLPTALLENIRELLGPSLACAWEVFYTESRRTHGVICKTYDYLAHKIGCSRRTAIRYVKRLMEIGILIVNKRFHHGCNIDNEFILLAPEEALCAANNAPDRAKPDLDIDFSVNLSQLYHIPDVGKMMPKQSENINSVDKEMTICHPSISGINKDIINTNHSQFANHEHQETEPKKVINALRQEEPSQNPVNSFGNQPKSIEPAVVKRIEKIVKAIPGISNPSGLVREAIHFVTTQRKYTNPWAAVGAFKKLLGKDGCGSWRTPFGMRYEK